MKDRIIEASLRDFVVENNLTELSESRAFEHFINHCLISRLHPEQFDFEGEFAIVIGRPGRHIKSENWLDYVAGYTLLMPNSIFLSSSMISGSNSAEGTSDSPMRSSKSQ